MLHLVVGIAPWEQLIQFLGLDPIYTGAAIRAAGGVQVAGFAVAGPVGTALHSLLPSVFLACDQVAARAGVSMVATPGAPAIGRGLAAFGADVIWLTIGLALFWYWRHRGWGVALLGLLIQAQIAVNHLLDAHIALADLDASGLPFAIQVAIPDGGWVTNDLATLPSETSSFILGVTLLALGYLIAALVLRVSAALIRLHIRTGDHVRTDARWSGQLNRASAALCAFVALAAAWSPIGALAVGNSNWHSAATAVSGIGLRGPNHTSPGHKHSLRLAGATPVEVIHQSDGSWQYVVDGTAEMIRGVGYNPWYANLSPAQRTQLYDRDFADMRRLGINTIEGWFDNQFDEVTLDAAARNGIGVLMPFELNQDWDFTNPGVRAGTLERLSAYVEKYKNHPAVRMWSPGNENLHRVLYSHWVSQANVPAARAKAEAVAAFLVVAADRIHELDPDHPVVYRDAEDVYLPWIINAFNQAGGERPWLVYGANVYSAQRLQDIVGRWPSQWPGQPLLISEFAPGGVGPAERPIGFQLQWRVIRSRPDVVLGGLAYTWSTNGPEDLDRVFGLVDPNAVPTDGALAALSSAYLADGAG